MNLFLRVRALKIHPSWLHAEVAHEIQFQVEHFRPEIRDLLVANPLLAGHIRARDEALLARIFPMGLPADAAHKRSG